MLILLPGNPFRIFRFPPARHGRPVSLWVALGLAVIILTGSLLAPPAQGLVRFDFEQKYYRHQGRQVWDFSIIRPDSIYHLFYHSIHEQTPNAAFGDTIWQAQSPDLKHWGPPVPILTVGGGGWETGAIWAPDVFRDDANDRWALAYTACDANFNQTICLAFSPDLQQWTKAGTNPTVKPDTSLYVWDAAGQWSDFRDPFVYRQDDQWHMLATAKQDLGGFKGVLYHGTSPDLQTWTDVGPIFANDGPTPGRVLESPQYHVLGATHHLLFGEFDTPGISLVSAPDPAAWTMANRVLLEAGNAYAPEVDEFDPGVPVYSRLAAHYLPGNTQLGYVARFDTLRTNPDGSNPTIHKPHPLAGDWLVLNGTANLASPTFGDNPVWRGEPSVGLVGNSYYSTREYFQGPLSGRGAPGTMLGNPATGIAETHRFIVTGNRMDLLVGGGYYPQTCYVALVDAADSTILRSETGGGNPTMSPRQWDLTPFQGRLCFIRIHDQETGPLGFINVDEIEEKLDLSAVDQNGLPTWPSRHRAWPNPFNPRTTIGFELPAATVCEVRIYDLKGRLAWRSGRFTGLPGPNSVAWAGDLLGGGTAPAGTFLYAIEAAGRVRASGKLALVK